MLDSIDAARQEKKCHHIALELLADALLSDCIQRNMPDYYPIFFYWALKATLLVQRPDLLKVLPSGSHIIQAYSFCYTYIVNFYYQKLLPSVRLSSLSAGFFINCIYKNYLMFYLRLKHVKRLSLIQNFILISFYDYNSIIYFVLLYNSVVL